MPVEKETDLDKVKGKVSELIKDFGGEVGRDSLKEIAFGLKALEVIFVMEENIGSTDSLEENIQKIHDVKSVEVTDVRRAIG